VGLQTVSSHENLPSNDSRRLYDERPTGRSSYSRRESFERKSERTFRAKEPSVDTTRQVNMSVFCAEVFIVNWRADLRKYKNRLAENMFSNSLVRV